MLLEDSNTEPKISNIERNQLILGEKSGSVSNAPFTGLAFQLLQQMPVGSISRSVLLVSAAEPGLSTSASLSLAMTFAGILGQNVVLADVTGGALSLSEALDCSSAFGLAECADTADLSRALRPTSSPTIRFLPSGGEVTRSLPASTTSALLNYGLAGDSMLVVSGGSLLSSPVAMALAPQVGLVLVVVQEMSTQISAIRHLEQVLAAAGVQRAGMLLADPG